MNGVDVARTPPSPTPDQQETTVIAASSHETVEKLAGWLEAMSDTGVPIPRSEWTVGETGAHLAYAAIGWSLFARDMFYLHGDGTPQSFADANETGLMGLPERGGPQLARLLRDGTRNFLTEVAVREPDQHVYSPLGEMTLGVLTSYFLAHNLMHGCAVCAALDEDLLFQPEHLAQIWPFVCYAFQGPLVDPDAFQGVSTVLNFVVPDGFDFSITFRDGEAVISPQPSPEAACTVEVDALHLFLVLIKLLTVREAIDLDRLTVSGPQPELGTKFMDFFYVP